MTGQGCFDYLVIVLTTEANSTIANILAKEIMKRKLAACISLREVDSCFLWKGKIEQSNEVQLLIKTTQKQLKDLIDAIESLHSYELPELLFWNVSASESYQKWVEDELSKPF